MCTSFEPLAHGSAPPGTLWPLRGCGGGADVFPATDGDPDDKIKDKTCRQADRAELSIIMLAFLGWQLTLAEFVGARVMVALLVLLFRRFLTRELLEEAEAQADKMSGVFVLS